MFFAIHDTDNNSDTPGRITQGNKVFEPEGYHKRLEELGHSYVAINSPGLLPPDYWYVLLGNIHERPTMRIKVDKKLIKAGNGEMALIKGIPKRAKYFISTGGVCPFEGIMPDTEMEVIIPLPCVYKIIFMLWPFKDYTLEIEAVA